MAESFNCGSSCDLEVTSSEISLCSKTAEFDNAIKLEERLQQLRKLCHEKTVELKLIQQFFKDIRILKLFSKDDVEVTHICQLVEDSDEVPNLSEEQIKHIHELLEEVERLSNGIQEVSEKTRAEEDEIKKIKSRLKDYMIKRNHLWKMASEIYQRDTKKGSELEESDTNFETFKNMTYLDEESNEYKEEIASKIRRTTELSKVLNLLISFSGVKWAYNPDLLEIVLCTGKLLNSYADSEISDNLKKIVDDVNNRLNCVKI